jgi:hypothetical protein
MLHKQCASTAIRELAHCSHFAEGLVLSMKPSENIGVFAQRHFKRGECVVKEKAVVPWTRDDVWDNKRTAKLLSHLRSHEGKAQAKKIATMYPRSYDQIPTCVTSLAALRGRVEKLLGEISSGNSVDEDEIRESTRLLAAVKLNNHDDGCHGFGTFFNHSCSFNCEV